MSDYLLEMNGIVKTFDGVKALNGIDIRVRPGECMGLCGENGAGKSTLMNVLSAVYPYGTWDGEILWDGQPLRAKSISETEAAGIVIIHQELTLPGGRMNYPAMVHRAEALMRELKVPDMNVSLPVLQYGGGYQQLVEIAKALNKQARLLILDEPSSALTRSEIEVLLDIIRDLKAKGVACVYISHKLDEVAAVCDTISVIRDGKHIATTAMANMDIPMIITQMVGREMSNLYPTEPHDIGEVIFEARNVTCYDVDNPRRKRVDDISFVLKRGEILGIAGLVGAGRTELVSALFGAYPGRYQAEVLLEGQRVDTRTPLRSIRAGLCMVPEDRKRQGIIPDLCVGHNITLAVLKNYAKMTWIDSEAELSSVDKEIARMHLKTASPFLPITSLSGGNQQKAVLAKMLMTLPRVLILDEPTRGVDVGAKYEIYKLMGALAAQGVSIIMVSSELAEVLGVSDRVLVIGEGQLRGNFVNQELTQEQVLAAALSQPVGHNNNNRKPA